jgi:hypothetical protein
MPRPDDYDDRGDERYDGQSRDEYDDTQRTHDGPGEPDRRVAVVRRRVGPPGLMLQFFGASMIALNVACGGASIINPEALIDRYYDWVEDMQKQQPPAQRQQLPPRGDAVKSLRIEGPVYGIVGLVSGTFIFIGGGKMRALRGYGWAMAGSILSIFPGLCCCCVGLLPGIWALVVLLNADVKHAFSLATRAEAY